MTETIQYDPANDDCDVVIVGAGAAGAIMAHQFVEQGLKVIILEAGPKFGDDKAANNGGTEYHLDRFFAANAKVPSSPWRAESAAERPTVLDIDKDWQDNEKHYMIQKGPLPFVSTYERLSGGTTNHWLGTSLRLVPNDFTLNSSYNVKGAHDWPITYDQLEPWYAKAESEIGVSGDSTAWNDYLGAHRSSDYVMPAISSSYLDQQIQDKVGGKTINGHTVNVINTPAARNSIWYLNRDSQGRFNMRPPCMGNSSCIPICPVRAKYDASVHLDRAIGVAYSNSGYYDAQGTNKLLNPADIRYQSVAYQVQATADDNAITGVLYKKYQRVDPEDERSEYTISNHKVTGKAYVVAAHAIETAKLLLNSPWKNNAEGEPISVANTSDQVGRNLMDHTILLTGGLTEQPVYPFRGPLSTSGISSFRDSHARQQRAAYIIEIGNDGFAWAEGAPFGTLYKQIKQRQADGQKWYGKDLRNAVQQKTTRQLRLTVEFEPLPNPDNRVSLSSERDVLGIPRPEIHYSISDYTKDGFKDAAKSLATLWEELSATDVSIPVTDTEPDSPSHFFHDGKYYEYRGAGHIMGTYRMGDDSATSVVDSDCRSHDHPNLYLAGSGVFPACGTANPTLTIFALALRTANAIKGSLQ